MKGRERRKRSDRLYKTTAVGSIHPQNLFDHVQNRLPPLEVYKTTAERKSAYKALLARRKKRSKWVDANCGHKDADEFGCVHLDKPIQSTLLVERPPPDPPLEPLPANPIDELIKLGCIFACRPTLPDPIYPQKMQKVVTTRKASCRCSIPGDYARLTNQEIKSPFVGGYQLYIH
ncbi:hypothetical protein P8452_71554 [Trifolium repens]|nr:hypothetical protein P8452_71554 [Trifolium repens]